MTNKPAAPSDNTYQPSTNQKVLYQENQTRLSRPVQAPKRLVIKFSAIQPNANINIIQTWTRLHSMGSHKGSSSVSIASTDIAMKRAFKQEIASPVDRLKTSSDQSLNVSSWVHKYEGRANGFIDINLLYHKRRFIEGYPLLLTFDFKGFLVESTEGALRSLFLKVGNIPPFQ